MNPLDSLIYAPVTRCWTQEITPTDRNMRPLGKEKFWVRVVLSKEPEPDGKPRACAVFSLN